MSAGFSPSLCTALSGLYKYHGASCGLCEEEAVSPLGRRQQQPQGVIWGAGTGGHTVP